MVFSTFLTSGVSDLLFGNECSNSGSVDQLSGVLGFPTNSDEDMFFDGNVCSDSGTVDQLSGAVVFPAKEPISDGDMVFQSEVTPCWEKPAEDGIMPAVATAWDQFDQFDIVADQLFGIVCSDSDQLSGAVGFPLTTPAAAAT